MAYFMTETPFKVCIIEAPAKINLHLKIGEKRPDGYHDLESIFVPLAFGDTLRFQAVNTVFCPISHDDLIWKAVSLFRERSGCGFGLGIEVEKRIPLGAGLGGGSSDAASTLIALNLLAGGIFSMEELHEMAAFLGSDVPFFLYDGAAFVSGRGEIIKPVKTPENLWVVLVKPPFSSNTAAAFQMLDYSRMDKGTLYGESVSPKPFSQKPVSQKTVSQKPVSQKRLIRALKKNPLSWPYFNDFLPLFLGLNPAAPKEAGVNAGILDANLEALREAGASFTGLSGSGSTCFGVFSSKEKAEKAEKSLSGQENFTKLSFFLARKTDPVLE